MGKNIVVLTGSPRKKGNSFAMTQTFIDAAEANGHTVQRFDTAFLKISGCRGCYGCRETGQCVIRDDFTPIAEAITAADIVAFSTPLYFFTFSSYLKAALDRFFSLHRSYQLGAALGGKQCVLLACCADKDEEEYQALRYSYRMSIGEMDWTSIGEVLATGIWGTPDQEKLLNACTDAAALAQRLDA